MKNPERAFNQAKRSAIVTGRHLEHHLEGTNPLSLQMSKVRPRKTVTPLKWHSQISPGGQVLPSPCLLKGIVGRLQVALPWGQGAVVLCSSVG